MKKALAVVLVALLVLAGCEFVATKEPIGMPIWQDMQGTWILANPNEFDSAIEIFLLRDGSLVVVSNQWDVETGKITQEQRRLVISLEDGVLYANLAEDSSDNGRSNFFIFRLLRLSEDSVVLFLPNVEVFSRAIKAGRLKGERQGEDVTFSDSPQLAEFIRPEILPEQFAVEYPIEVRRVSNPGGPVDGAEPTILYQGKLDHSACLPKQFAQTLVGKHEKIVKTLEALRRLREAGAGQEELQALLKFGSITFWVGLTDEERFSYQACMENRGYEIRQASWNQELWFVLKNGFGLFGFSRSAVPTKIGQKPPE